MSPLTYYFLKGLEQKQTSGETRRGSVGLTHSPVQGLHTACISQLELANGAQVITKAVRSRGAYLVCERMARQGTRSLTRW